MKRFHVHLAVENIAINVTFYSQLFGQPPKVLKADYAKWMLDDPRLNFAISSRGAATGVNHLGLQAEDEAELAELETRAHAADAEGIEERGAACCYASGNKYWATDPQGIAWEHFQTLGDIPVFGTASTGTGAPDVKPASTAGCCVPGKSCG